MKKKLKRNSKMFLLHSKNYSNQCWHYIPKGKKCPRELVRKQLLVNLEGVNSSPSGQMSIQKVAGFLFVWNVCVFIRRLMSWRSVKLTWESSWFRLVILLGVNWAVPVTISKISPKQKIYKNAKMSLNIPQIFSYMVPTALTSLVRLIRHNTARDYFPRHLMSGRFNPQLCSMLMSVTYNIFCLEIIYAVPQNLPSAILDDLHPQWDLIT